MPDLTKEEIFIVKTAIENILHEIRDEIQTRTGFTEHDYGNILKTIYSNGVISNDSLVAISQALNEVCNGYNIENFKSLFGVDIDEGKSLLEKVMLSIK